MDELRLTLLPDSALAPLFPALQARLSAVGRSIKARNFGSILDGTMKQLFDGVVETVGATEGSIWLHEEGTESLTIAYNTGANSPKLIGKFKQPLNAGLISMVFSSEQSFVENQVFDNSSQDKTLDSILKVRTHAMIAVPFYYLDACRGVASCVQLVSSVSSAVSTKGFNENHEKAFRNASVILGRLIEHWATRKTIGLE
jgi:hypothetical protein